MKNATKSPQVSLTKSGLQNTLYGQTTQKHLFYLQDKNPTVIVVLLLWNGPVNDHLPALLKDGLFLLLGFCQDVFQDVLWTRGESHIRSL